MKKKILFMSINMNVGGTEKALLNMVSEIPKETYDITIYMLEEYGGFLNSIPSDVHVEYFKGYKNIKGILNNPPHLTTLDFLKRGRVIKAFTILMLLLLSKMTNDRSFFFKYVLYNYPKFKNEYDIAVAYDGPMDFISYFVIHRIKAKKKIQWIHFDITKIGFNKYFAARLHKRFDKLFVVSSDRQLRIQFSEKLASENFISSIQTQKLFNVVN